MLVGILLEMGKNKANYLWDAQISCHKKASNFKRPIKGLDKKVNSRINNRMVNRKINGTRENADGEAQPAGSASLWIGRGEKARCKQGDLQSHGNACQQASQRASRDTDVPSGVGCLMTTWTRFVFFRICREAKWVVAENMTIHSEVAQLNAQVGKGRRPFCKENTKDFPEYPHSERSCAHL